MSFARQNPGKPLFSQAQIVSARERVLLAENQNLRKRNKRLKEAMLTLVERIEMQLPHLKDAEASAARQKQDQSRERARDEAFRARSRRYRTSPPKMEIFETFEEPIAFADPAPEMRLGEAAGAQQCRAKQSASSAGAASASAPGRDFHISPDLAPEEIDILKSPTRERMRSRPLYRETVEVVDLHLARNAGPGATEHYEAGEAAASDIPAFDFTEEPVVDIDFERKESLRAAMRRRANRLRW